MLIPNDKYFHSIHAWTTPIGYIEAASVELINHDASNKIVKSASSRANYTVPRHDQTKLDCPIFHLGRLLAVKSGVELDS